MLERHQQRHAHDPVDQIDREAEIGPLILIGAGMVGSIAVVLFGAAWSLAAHAITGRGGSMFRPRSLRVFGTFVIAQFAFMALMAASEGVPALAVICLVFAGGLALAFYRRGRTSRRAG